MSEEEKINRLNAESENPQQTNGAMPSAEQANTPVEQTEPAIINQQKSIESMEVHHRPHVEKKNFKEYFFEFIMIFLAVTMGFFAESIQEHFNNKEIEKRNIESLVRNLDEDSTNLTQAIRDNQKTVNTIDSLVAIPSTSFAKPGFQQRFFYFVNNLLTRYAFISDESAFDQMQSSGTLRLIKNHDVTDSILQYTRQNKIIRELDAYIDQWFSKSIGSLARFTDLRARLNQEPMKMNKNYGDVSEYINYKVMERIALYSYIGILKHQLRNLDNLIPFLKKEYHLQN